MCVVQLLITVIRKLSEMQSMNRLFEESAFCSSLIIKCTTKNTDGQTG